MVDNKLTPASGTAMATVEATDDLVMDAGRGTENIGPDDVRPPRLLICQAGSPQRKPDDPKQIPGLQELDMFNDLSNEIYGRGPLNFVVVQMLGHRHMEFAPFNEGGGVIDFDVPDGDPRTEFTTDKDGVRQKPIATKFYDYLVWLSDKQELVVLSFKSTQIKVAIKLNGVLRLPLKIDEKRSIPNPPSWARTFALGTRMDKDGDYSWGGFTLQNVGITPQEVRLLIRQMADAYATKKILIPVDDTDGPVVSTQGGSESVSSDPPPF